MKQYCRYCVYMCCGNGGNWCEVKQREFPESKIKRTNNCKDFEFCEIDALYGVDTYKPRPPRAKKNYEQIKIESEESK